MSEQERYPSYTACVALALSSSQAPLNMESLLDKVAGQRPMGKGARSAVARAVHQLFQAVPVAPDCVGWLSHLLRGATFRHPLTSEEARRGYLLLDELEHIAFFPQFFQFGRAEDRRVTISLDDGPTFQAEAAIERKTWSLRLGAEFVGWLDDLGGQNRDDLLITVVDALAGRYSARLQMRELRDENAIRRRNVALVQLAEEIVGDEKRLKVELPTWELAARLIARGFYAATPAPDDLHFVLHEHSTLRLTDNNSYRQDPAGASVRQERAWRNSKSASPDALAPDGLELFDGRESDSMMANELDNRDPDDDGICPDYEQYLEYFYQTPTSLGPLSHEDYHLLEGELDLLVQLEQEFGHLLPEQQGRKAELADRLFIDPDSLVNMDWGAPDDPSNGDPPFWHN